jgi:hypothetical protein
LAVVFTDPIVCIAQPAWLMAETTTPRRYYVVLIQAEILLGRHAFLFVTGVGYKFGCLICVDDSPYTVVLVM